MMYPKLNIIPILFIMLVVITSCSTTSNNSFGQVEDDIYFSRKQSHKKPVYVPEVDVKEIIKANPPQYGDQNERKYNDNNNGSSNFNYDDYKNQQNIQSEQQYQPSQSESFLNTVPYIGQEEEAAEASRLRQQYYGNYNTYNNYYTDPYYSNNYGYNNWGYPTTTLGIGWNSWGGIGVGWGWNSGWGYGWPHYNLYWGGMYGWNSWGFNNWYSPYNYYGGWGWNNWYGGGYGYYPGHNWGHNGYSERTTPKQQRPRQSMGSSLPRGTDNNQPRGSQIQSNTNTEPQHVMPRGGNQGQIINRDGQQIYVAPEQNRTMPRTYNSYEKSVGDAEKQRAVTPAPTQPQQRTAPRNLRNEQPAKNNTPNTQPKRTVPNTQPRNHSNPPPQQHNPQPRNINPAPSAPRSSPAPSTPSGGGNRGGGSGGGSMPRR